MLTTHPSHAFYRLFTLTVLLPLCAGAAPGERDFRIDNGALKYQNKDFRITAFHVPYVGESGSAFAVRVATLVRIAEVGGNTVCFDLAGFNADGTQLDPKGVEVVAAFADRVKDQAMGVLVRVLGDSTDPAFRKKAVRTAATALKDEGRVAYWIDGPDAAALARAFKEIAPDRLVFAPDGGDAKTVAALPGAAPEECVLVTGHIAPKDWAHAHMVLAGTPENYQALDLARTHPAEMMPWTPDNSVLSEAERAEGFIALFNGRNLDGWWSLGENPNGYKVNDGVIEWAEKGGRPMP
mgnify:CR=1 FL=1